MSGNKILAAVVSLALLGAGCAPAPAAPPLPAPSTSQEAVYVLVALDGNTAFDRAPVATTFGCHDRLMMQRVAVPKSDRPALEVNLNALFAVRHAEAEALGLHTPLGDQAVRATVSEEDGKVVVNLAPRPISAGTCADPRITEIVEQTAKLTIGYVPIIRIEGSEAEWRCYGDMSGRCN